MGKKGIRIKDVEHLRRIFRNSPVKVEGAYLFGSRARGDFLEESDWDMLVVSSAFAKIPFPERATYPLRKLPLRRVELLCYTPDEIRKRRGEEGIIKEALKGARIL
ncbi:MAG: nucleotidyltransferase domain-containing protein [Candidatus Hadarchaeales archaeon]